MTYLEIVNQVLTRLREDTVTGLTASYSKLIGEFVNQAIYECEHSWDWSVLIETITITTAASDNLYDFHTADTKIIESINETKQWYVRNIPHSYQYKHDYLIALEDGSPYFYSFEGKNGEYSQVKLTPTPIGIESIRFLCVKYTDQLLTDGTDNTDVIKLPELPIILKAYALAVSERGEDGGATFNEADAKANEALANAISMDVTKNHYSEVSWNAV